MFITALSIIGLLLAEGTHVAGAPTGVILENLRASERVTGLSVGDRLREGSGLLAQGEHIAIPLSLPPHGTFFVVAVCDNDCTDVDLWAEDVDGQPLGGDFEARSIALLTIQTPASGAVRLNVSMPACSIEPCAYGYRLYSAVASGW